MICAYFKEYGTWYLLYMLSTAVYHLMFYLYHLPQAYFLASFSINLVFIIGLTILNYQTFKRKMLSLETLKAMQDFPKPQLPSEKAYEGVLKRLVEAEAQEVLSVRKAQDDLEGLVKMWTHQMKVPVSALSLMTQTNQLISKDVQVQLFRLEKEINDLLVFLKYQRHNDDYRFERVSLRNCMSSVIKTYSSQCIAKQIHINLKGNGTIVTDAKWLSFCISQVLDNAIKYSPIQSIIDININTSSISIQDYGIGILQEDLPRIYDQGFTGYNGHEHQKATGLGLYMTKQILDKLGITITIKSQIEKGTTVILEKTGFT